MDIPHTPQRQQQCFLLITPLETNHAQLVPARAALGHMVLNNPVHQFPEEFNQWRSYSLNELGVEAFSCPLQIALNTPSAVKPVTEKNALLRQLLNEPLTAATATNNAARSCTSMLEALLTTEGLDHHKVIQQYEQIKKQAKVIKKQSSLTLKTPLTTKHRDVANLNAIYRQGSGQQLAQEQTELPQVSTLNPALNDILNSISMGTNTTADTTSMEFFAIEEEASAADAHLMPDDYFEIADEIEL